MDVETRQAALCIIRRNDAFLVAEISDPQTGLVLHRPPGGGIEVNESPEQAIRREVREELSIVLTTIESLGFIDHVWFWNGREVRERAWLFLAAAAIDPSLDGGDLPVLLEADGEQFKTVRRSLDADSEALPPLCPSALAQVLRPILAS